jgi:hypothetical protein
MQSTEPTIEIARPRLFTLGAALIVNAYGLLLVAPLFAAILVVSVIPFGLLTWLIPVLVIGASAFFLPFGLGNTHIARLVRSQNAAAKPDGEGFIVQLTFSPRIRSGLQATLEDADDIGYLSFSAMGLQFQGDSVKLSVPYDRIAQVQPHNVGLRGRFVYGRRIKVVVTSLPNVDFIEFAERSSWLLPNSRAMTKRLFQRLSTKATQGVT